MPSLNFYPSHQLLAFRFRTQAPTAVNFKPLQFSMLEEKSLGTFTFGSKILVIHGKGGSPWDRG